ncbi:MAG: hypothetical protein ABNH26_13365 [Celeribacter sp.]|jgi:hypothetical protein
MTDKPLSEDMFVHSLDLQTFLLRGNTKAALWWMHRIAALRPNYRSITTLVPQRLQPV